MLSTHVLDTVTGAPAAGIDVSLYRLDNSQRALVATAQTDDDGRIARIGGERPEPGVYELLFAVGAYFARHQTASFYDEIPVRFTLDASARKHHVPLLLSPYGYSTYRGS